MNVASTFVLGAKVGGGGYKGVTAVRRRGNGCGGAAASVFHGLVPRFSLFSCLSRARTRVHRSLCNLLSAFIRTNDGSERWGRSLLTSHSTRLRPLWRRRLKRRALHVSLRAQAHGGEVSRLRLRVKNIIFRVERDVSNVASIVRVRAAHAQLICTFAHLHIREAMPPSLA